MGNGIHEISREGKLDSMSWKGYGLHEINGEESVH